MQPLAHTGPALCAQFVEGLVYAGYGPYVQIYKYHTGELINKCQVFYRNKVHGLSIDQANCQVLVYGARSIAVIPIGTLEKLPDATEFERTLNEWVISGEFSYTSQNIYLLTSYNQVLICRISDYSIIERKSIYGERSILYSGSIRVISNKTVYVNAGTVMDGVLIWDLYNEKMVQALKGHAGSIFCVTVDKQGKYAASCSDDRSIRIWDIESGAQLAIGWGHTARIWNLKFVKESMNLISVSEDCTCRLWDIVASTDGYELRQRGIYEVHLTKNVWAVDVQETEMIAVTAGNDGRLKLTDLEPLLPDNQGLMVFNLATIATKYSLDIVPKEIIKGFYWLTSGLIAMTSLGNILLYETCSQKWSLISKCPQMQSYSITKGIYEHNCVVFANNKCDIVLLKMDGKEPAQRILRLNELSKINNCLVVAFDLNSFLLVAESPNPKDKLICLRINSTNFETIKKWEFTKEEHFNISCLEIYKSFLLIGSRYSSLGMFNLSTDEHREPAIIRRLSPGDTTTSIRLVETIKEHAVFSVTNKDGYYTFIKVNFKMLETGFDSFYEIIHSNKVARGFLEDAFFNKANEYITYGFKSSLFYMHNETNNYEIASQVCGGAHRQWGLFSLGHDEQFVLVYIKASELYIRTFKKPMMPDVLQQGTHGREIRDISILKGVDYKSGVLFCTASEDTTLRLGHFNPTTNATKTYWTQRKHVSGLQRCKFINQHFMISSSAREELILWEINISSEQRPYMNIKHILPVFNSTPDLRIMDFDTVLLQDGSFIMVTVYSDSAVKLWKYNHDENSFTMVAEGYYKTCCLLNVSIFQIKTQTYILIGATDGHLSLYDVSKAIELDQCTILSKHLLNIQIHQSGIKALTVDLKKDGSLLVYTGGDDNALTMTKLCCQEDIWQGRIQHVVANAAASTITSCNLIDGWQKLLTVSVDQKMRVWRIQDNTLELEETQYTTVADTGSLDTTSLPNGERIAMVGGVGLSIWKI